MAVKVTIQSINQSQRNGQILLRHNRVESVESVIYSHGSASI
jgi:hypothetical protein